MTDGQKDAIVKAAQAVISIWDRADKWTPPLHQTASEESLVAAVRAAEQPRWTWEVVGKEGLVRHDGAFVFSVRSDSGEVFGVMPEMCRKLCRLLNEDDARQKP